MHVRIKGYALVTLTSKLVNALTLLHTETSIYLLYIIITTHIISYINSNIKNISAITHKCQNAIQFGHRSLVATLGDDATVQFA